MFNPDLGTCEMDGYTTDYQHCTENYWHCENTGLMRLAIGGSPDPDATTVLCLFHASEFAEDNDPAIIISLRCPVFGHGPGQQMPQYAHGATTGWFRCDCGVVYLPGSEVWLMFGGEHVHVRTLERHHNAQCIREVLAAQAALSSRMINDTVSLFASAVQS